MKRYARLNFKNDMDLGYTEGFRRAALHLAAVMEEGRDIDYLVYPMGYLFRHHIELQLKYLRRKTGELTEHLDVPPKLHELQKLWIPLRDKLARLQPDENFFKQIDSGIGWLDGLDFKSQEFRYPVTSKGRSLAGTRLFDVEEFSQNCEELAKNLQAIRDWLDVAIDTKYEELSLVSDE